MFWISGLFVDGLWIDGFWLGLDGGSSIVALQLKNRVRGTTTTTGTGTYTIGAAPVGFQGFNQITSGRQVHYCATDDVSWEVGIGTVTVAANVTLSRDTIIESSNSGGAVNWGAGTRTIFVIAAAQALEALQYSSSKRHGDFDGTLRVMDTFTAQDGVNVGGSLGGTADDITVVLTPAITEYGAMMPVVFTPSSDNTGAATLAVNGLTARSIVKSGGDALIAGDLKSGIPVFVFYDLPNTRWILINPQKKITISTSAPSGGSDGDIWYRYV